MNVVTNMPRRASSLKGPQLYKYDARDLIGGGVQACIALDGKAYYLRITRAGKSILTK